MAVVCFLFCSLQTQSRSKILYKPALRADSYGCLTTEGNPILVVAATNKDVSTSLLATITVAVFSSISTSIFITPSTLFSELRTATIQPTQVMFSTSSTMIFSPCCSCSAASPLATLPTSTSSSSASNVASVNFRLIILSTRIQSFSLTIQFLFSEA